MPGISGSMLGPVGGASVNFGWVRETKFDIQFLYLCGRSMRFPAYGWDGKQAKNKSFMIEALTAI